MSSKIEISGNLISSNSTKPVDLVALYNELCRLMVNKYLKLNESIYVLVSKIHFDGFSVLYDGIKVTYLEPSNKQFGVLVERKHGEFIESAAVLMKMMYEGKIEECTEAEVLEKVNSAKDCLKSLTDFGFKMLEHPEDTYGSRT